MTQSPRTTLMHQWKPDNARRALLRGLLCGLASAALANPAKLRTGAPLRSAQAQENQAVQSELFSATDLQQHGRGNPDAPNTLIEYASLTCPHCAHFHLRIFPRLQKEWIDSGRLYFLYRHFPLDGVAVRAALLAECQETDDAFFSLVDLLFQSQEEWAAAAEPVEALVKRAALAGIADEKARECMDAQNPANKERIAQMSKEYEDAARELNVRATPTLFFNRVRVRANRDPDDFLKQLELRAADA